MPAGNKKSRVHDVFRDRLTALLQQARAAGDAARGAGQRAWFVPPAGQARDLFDVAALHKPGFDRTEVNTNYEQCFQDIDDMGTGGDVIALKIQIDYNAAEERAFRLRHASAVRCLAHAAGRRYGEGVGPVFPYVEETVGDVIAAGASEPPTAEDVLIAGGIAIAGVL